MSEKLIADPIRLPLSQARGMLRKALPVTVLLASAGVSQVASAATPTFDANCGACHGNGNAGTAVAGPVKGKNASQIQTAINSVTMMAGLKGTAATTLCKIATEIGGKADLAGCATPTPTPSASPSPTPKPSASPSPTPKPSASPSPTPKPSASPSPTPKPSTSPSPTPKPSATPKPTPAPHPCKDDDDHDRKGTRHDDDHESRGKCEHDDDHASKPELDHVPGKVVARVGSTTKFAVTAHDESDREVKIKASHLPKGAKVFQDYDDELKKTKAVVKWTPHAGDAGKKKAISFQAVAGGKASKAETVNIVVLPQAANSAPALPEKSVKSASVATARYDDKSHLVKLSGKVRFHKGAQKAEREQARATPVTVIDPTSNAELAQAKVGKHGKWKVSIPVDGDGNAPCLVETDFHGMKGIKPVSGAKHCDQ